jgi:hypothetical protein
MKLIKILLSAGALAIAIAFAPAAQALEVGVHAGVFLPQGDAGDAFDSGLTYELYLGTDFAPMFDSRFFIGNYSAKAENSNFDDLSANYGGLMLVFSPPIPGIAAHIGLGYALYQTSYGADESKWGHGIVAEAGLGFSVVLAEFGLYANYMENTLNDDDLGDLELGGYSVGLRASIGF